MIIQSHKLVAEAGDTPVKWLNSPNQSGVIQPKYLIIHYTAGRNAKSSIDWFMNPQANASAHLVIAQDGTITQMVPFNKKSFHAGISHWAGLEGMNSHSIGIELDNPGKLKQVGHKWMAWFGTEYPASKLLVAPHKHQTVPSGWHVYTQAQIESCIKASLAIFHHYRLKDILGHDDISPGRKEDPGPAFPMESFKSRVMGRLEDHAPLYKVVKEGARFRAAPSLDAAIMGKLKLNTKVEFIRSHMDWFLVKLIGKVPGIIEPEGWVHSSLLTRL
ncbi:MAG TPA: N-acetylmuramoyl-L-alanine amidase [Phnomibacter sp.]|nr:N-acetylmuramoyl-L-alanine amidase [Phnomibacter sp.]